MLVNNVLIRKLKAPIYDTRLWIVVGEVRKAIDTVEDLIDHRIIEESGKRSIYAYTYAFEEHDGGYRVLIFVSPKTTPGIIAHEANHATNIILSWHGVKPSFTNDENECYYLEQMVDKIHDTIKLYNKKCNPQHL